MITNSNTLIDNSEQLKMVEALKECLSPDNHLTQIKIATGYWDIPGLALIEPELRTFIQNGGKLQLLIGNDPVVRAYQLNDPQCKGKFPQDYIKKDLRELEVKPEYQAATELLVSHLGGKDSGAQIQVCTLPEQENGDSRFLHAKCYIFIGQNYRKGIVGSSNFTKKGLEDNDELNFIETSYVVVNYNPQQGEIYKGHIYWFDQLWETAVDWSGELLVELQDSPNKPAPIEPNGCITPYELYIRYLQSQFGDMLEPATDDLIKSYLPSYYTAYQFQIDAVKQCYSIMRRYGGFILGDVVGLGKTVVGTLIIRRFIDEASSLGRPTSVLLITPPAIQKGWRDTINEFDACQTAQINPYVDFLTTGKIQGFVDEVDTEDDLFADNAETFDQELGKKHYGLILIDESHGFRNNQTKKYKALDALIGRSNPTPYIGLLSATPQNNAPQDLLNQIRLFLREPKNCPLAKVPGGDLIKFFNDVQLLFNDQRNNTNKAEQQKAIKRISESIRDCVLSDLVVRRTRADIKANYPQDSRQLHFPSIEGPHEIQYAMSSRLAQLFADTMDCICPMNENGELMLLTDHNIGFYRYAAIAYFADESNKKLYEKNNLTVEGITRDLETMMRILLVKRLESSFAAFRESLEHLLQNTEIMLSMLDHDAVFVCPDIDVNAEFRSKDNPDELLPFEEAAENIRKKIAKKRGNNREFHAADFDKQYRADIRQDIRLIKKLCERWQLNNEDPKFDVFKQALKKELFDTEINNPHKLDKPRLVIFTEAIATQTDIVRYAREQGHRVLTISSKNRDEKANIIAANFDANYKGDQRDDYDVLVTTEVLAEGVNLHRANVILNYDAPWNSTRLMQRIGRVNRIGSKEDQVHVFNFFPTGEGNNTIHLIEKTYAKLQSFHVLFGEDSKIFSQAEEVVSVDLTHNIQSTFEGDTSPDGEFIRELREFQQAHPLDYQRIQAMPWGLQLGGQLSANGQALVAYTDEQSVGLLPLRRMATNAKWEVVSSYDTMAYLRCAPDAVFEKGAALSEELQNTAHKEYIKHYNKRFGNQQQAKTNQALQALKEIQEQCNPSDRKLIGDIAQIIRGGNNHAANTIIKFNDERQKQALFDSMEGVDLSQWLHRTFDKMVENARTKRGEAEIAFWENK